MGLQFGLFDVSVTAFVYGDFDFPVVAVHLVIYLALVLFSGDEIDLVPFLLLWPHLRILNFRLLWTSFLLGFLHQLLSIVRFFPFLLLWLGVVNIGFLASGIRFKQHSPCLSVETICFP